MTKEIPSSAAFLNALNSRKKRLEIIGKKENVSITEFQPLQSVFVSNCSDCTINVPYKAAQVTIDNCSNVTFQVNEVAGTLELINSTNCVVRSVSRCLSFTVDVSKECTVNIVHRITQEDLDIEERARRRVQAVETAIAAHQHELPTAQAAADPDRPSEAKLFVKEAKYPWTVFSSKSRNTKVEYSFVELNSNEATASAQYSIPDDGSFELGDGPRYSTRVVDGVPTTLKCVNNYGDV